MKATDFSKYISIFLTKYLPDEKGYGRNTISSYRDTFVLLLIFIKEEKHIKVEKLSIDMVTKNIILEFLDWLQQKRKCGNATRNIRLAAIHSFYRFLQYESLENLYECQKILSIKFKKEQKKVLKYLTIDGIKLLFQQPDRSNQKGRRDLTLLSLLYDTGARVQELIDMTPSMIQLDNPPTIKIKGKGNKIRIVPMLDKQVDHLKNYLKENNLDKSHTNLYPLFFNSRKEKLTRAGVAYIIQKYTTMARRKEESLIPEKISCHSFRHSKAMHLLQAGVNLVYIRDILGHVSIQTTEIYARADSKQKREAIEKAYVDVNPNEEPVWESNMDLLKWLKSF